MRKRIKKESNRYNENETDIKCVGENELVLRLWLGLGLASVSALDLVFKECIVFADIMLAHDHADNNDHHFCSTSSENIEKILAIYWSISLRPSSIVFCKTLLVNVSSGNRSNSDEYVIVMFFSRNTYMQNTKSSMSLLSFVETNDRRIKTHEMPTMHANCFTSNMLVYI